MPHFECGVLAPSAGDPHEVPHAMTKDDIKRCLDESAAAAKRVDRIGYDVIELHGALGYLAHQFLSPLSNKRTDEYGGSLENRMRFALEMYEAVRAVWPQQKPLGMRPISTCVSPTEVMPRITRYLAVLPIRGISPLSTLSIRAIASLCLAIAFS
jgi:2,4-dienoyl-CoA reductase-like NADH-dependent reductase (Old Yellow Enzyme family)